ncbi:MAG: transporter [Deltaproteobacteria bacterium]|nr:transporter [Deltaproteobacteria bacterium]
MQGKWGIAWLAAIIVLVSLTCAPLPGLAADRWDRGGMPFTLAGAQTPMEAQMLGEKPFQSRPAPLNPGSDFLSNLTSGLQVDQDGGAALKISHNLEMRISVLYDSEPGRIEPQKRNESSLLMKSSLDYRLLPNLQVGLNAYLYRPDSSDSLSLSRQFAERVMGVGPGLKYDLGRWSFMLKSQLETGNRDQRADGMQSSVRVWYAF